MTSLLIKQMAELDEQRKELIKKLNAERSQKVFLCACCGQMHTISECDAIQTHWYTEPRGCNEGDYWNEGQLQIVCPVTDHKNRILFKSYLQVDWQLRNSLEYSAEMQFKAKYKWPKLFKSITDAYCKDQRPWVNCMYFDENRAYFDLHVKGLDPEIKS